MKAHTVLSLAARAGKDKKQSSPVAYQKKCIIFFASLTKKIAIILIYSHQTAVLLAVVMFLFDYLSEKRSVPLTK